MGDYSRYDADDGEIIMSQAKRLIVCGVNNNKDVELTSRMLDLVIIKVPFGRVERISNSWILLFPFCLLHLYDFIDKLLMKRV